MIATQRVILPTQSLIGILTDQDYFITESYGLTLQRLLSDTFNLSLTSSPDIIVTDPEQLKTFINWDYVERQYNLLRNVAPCKLDYEVVARVYLRVFAALYITLQEYMYVVTLPYRYVSSPIITVSEYSVVSDGICITYSCDYLPF